MLPLRRLRLLAPLLHARLRRCRRLLLLPQPIPAANVVFAAALLNPPPGLRLRRDHTREQQHAYQHPRWRRPPRRHSGSLAFKKPKSVCHLLRGKQVTLEAVTISAVRCNGGS
jgi:hypothetical protein